MVNAERKQIFSWLFYGKNITKAKKTKQRKNPKRGDLACSQEHRKSIIERTIVPLPNSKITN